MRIFLWIPKKRSTNRKAGILSTGWETQRNPGYFIIFRLQICLPKNESIKATPDFFRVSVNLNFKTSISCRKEQGVRVLMVSGAGDAILAANYSEYYSEFPCNSL